MFSGALKPPYALGYHHGNREQNRTIWDYFFFFLTVGDPNPNIELSCLRFH